jgi:hypothetical protein
MGKYKKYKITTVQDMVDCTNEGNLDNFLKDLKGIIQTAHSLNAITEVISGKQIGCELEDKGFTWIDDGKNEGKITIISV